MESAKPDQRRETGLRTRARLMDAALDLIAERGEKGLTLRELTDAAEANVAAVSYHFGSLGSLCEAAIEAALESYLDAQHEAVRALAPFVRRSGAMGARCMDRNRAITVTRFRRRCCWARCARHFPRSSRNRS